MSDATLEDYIKEICVVLVGYTNHQAVVGYTLDSVKLYTSWDMECYTNVTKVSTYTHRNMMQAPLPLSF